jgi:hypothetical protein
MESPKNEVLGNRPQNRLEKGGKKAEIVNTGAVVPNLKEVGKAGKLTPHLHMEGEAL